MSDSFEKMAASGCLLFLFVTAIGGGGMVWDAMTATSVQDNAEDLARQWVTEMYPADEARGARLNCQAVDSDSNGYVSCTLMITHEEEEQLVPIECHAYVMFNFGDSCRALVPYGMGQRR